MATKYAQINGNGIVVGVSTLARAVNAPGLVELAADQNPLGMQYNAETGEFSPVPEAERREISRTDFMDRISDDELAAIIAAGRQDARTQGFIERLKMAGSVRLDNQRVIDGLAALEAVGALDEGRADEIRGV